MTLRFHVRANLRGALLFLGFLPLRCLSPPPKGRKALQCEPKPIQPTFLFQNRALSTEESMFSITTVAGDESALFEGDDATITCGNATHRPCLSTSRVSILRHSWLFHRRGVWGRSVGALPRPRFRVTPVSLRTKLVFVERSAPRACARR